jgi:hypothetical protein
MKSSKNIRKPFIKSVTTFLHALLEIINAFLPSATSTELTNLTMNKNSLLSYKNQNIFAT